MWSGTEDGGHAWRWRWRNKGARVQLGGWMDDWMRGGVKRVTAMVQQTKWQMEMDGEEGHCYTLAFELKPSRVRRHWRVRPSATRACACTHPFPEAMDGEVVGARFPFHRIS